MQGITYKYKGKPAYAYYQCNGRVFKFPGLDCKMPAVKRKPIEALVWEKIVEIVTNPGLIQVSLTDFEFSGAEKELAKIDKKLEQKGMERERLISAYRKGIIEIGDLEEQIGFIKSEIAAIEERKEELDELLHAASQEQRITDILYDQLEVIQDRIENCSFQDKQEITRLIVRKVWLDMEGNVEIEARIPLGPVFPMLERANSYEYVTRAEAAC